MRSDKSKRIAAWLKKAADQSTDRDIREWFRAMAAAKNFVEIATARKAVAK